MRGITKAAALEWGKDNIRVERARALWRAAGEPRDELVPEAVRGDRHPLGRYGDPETEIGHAIAFLATNTYITGRTLMIDGGIGTFR